MQLVADGAVQEHGGHGAVHTAAEAEDHLVLAHLGLEVGHGGLDEALGRPLGAALADVEDEVAQQLHAVDAVVHLGVELDGIGGFALDLVAGIADVLGGADGAVAVGQLLDGVAMAHPHLRVLRYALHEGVGGVDEREVGAAVLAGLALLHAAAAVACQVLGAVADGQQGQAPLDTLHLGHGGVGGVAAEGAAAEDDALHIGSEGGNLVERMDFAVYVLLAYLARDELSVLRTKV